MAGGRAWLLWCSAQIRSGAQPGATVVCFKIMPPKYDHGQDKHHHTPVLRHVLHVLALHVSTATATGPAAPEKWVFEAQDGCARLSPAPYLSVTPEEPSPTSGHFTSR